MSEMVITKCTVSEQNLISHIGTILAWSMCLNQFARGGQEGRTAFFSTRNKSTWHSNVLGVGLFDVLEHERVVAQLPQLHDRVHQGLGVRLVGALRRLGQHHALLLHVTEIISFNGSD